MSVIKDVRKDLSQQAASELMPSDIQGLEPSLMEPVKITSGMSFGDASKKEHSQIGERFADSLDETDFSMDFEEQFSKKEMEMLLSKESLMPQTDENSELFRLGEEAMSKRDMDVLENDEEEMSITNMLKAEYDKSEKTLAAKEEPEELPIEELLPEEEKPVEEEPIENLLPEPEEFSTEELLPEEEKSEEGVKEILPEPEELLTEELLPEEEKLEEAAAKEILPEPEEFPVEELLPEEEKLKEAAAEEMLPESEELPVEELLPEEEKLEEAAAKEILPEPEEFPVEELLPEEEKLEEAAAKEILPEPEEFPVEELLPEEEKPVEEAVGEKLPKPEELPEEEPPIEELPVEELLPEEEEPEAELSPEVFDELVNRMDENKNEESSKMEMKEQNTELEEKQPSDNVTVITKGTRIDGSIYTDGSLEIQGVVGGNATCLGKLSIFGKVFGDAEGAEIFINETRLEGGIKSESTVKIGVGTVIVGNISGTSAVIAGAVRGDIDVNGPVILDSTAVVQGNITAKSIQINNGAIIEGHCSLSHASININEFFDEETAEGK